ncbi:MAG: serine hydrolase, partial [Salinimicrobium sediminis]|nr:serine hydrolase [Salinimicrobium sediminis]
MKSLINFSLMLFLGMSLSAQDFNKQKMDSLFSAIDENNKGMGSLSIYKNGNEVYTSSTGFANVEAKKAADAQTRYRVGSITKTFTAAIIMQLIEEGKLQLETKLSAFYSQIPNAGKISMEDLLRHQSGLFNYSKVEDFENWKDKEQSRQDHLERFVKNGIEFQPGERSDYSNTNYILLSIIIEDLEKEDLKFGFIKLTDMAPLAIAYEKGFFEEEGL